MIIDAGGVLLAAVLNNLLTPLLFPRSAGRILNPPRSVDFDCHQARNLVNFKTGKYDNRRRMTKALSRAEGITINQTCIRSLISTKLMAPPALDAGQDDIDRMCPPA